MLANRRRLPHLLVCALILTLTASGCESADDRPRPISHPDRMTVWVEFVSPAEVDPLVDFAAAHRLDINLAAAEGEHDDGYLQAFCAAAERADVALRLWPLLPESAGYWPNQGNATRFAGYVRDLAARARTHCPRAEGFVVDLEMPIDRARTIEQMFTTGASVTDIVLYLQQGIDATAFEAARAVFTDLTVELQGDGYVVNASTLPMLVDDRGDGDEGIAKALWTPLEGIPFDTISFQVYRSIFDDQFAAGLSDPSQRFTAGLIHSYAASIVAYYGERGAIDLGTVGTSGIGVPTGVSDASELQADIAAALDAGIPPERINLYSLEGILEHADAATWVSLPAPAAPPIDPSATEIRNLFANLDLLAQ